MEHRTLVQRSSQSVQREPCSPIMQLGDVTQSSQLQCCNGIWESSLVVQPGDEAKTRGALPEKVFISQNGDVSAAISFSRAVSVRRPFRRKGVLSFFAGEYDKLQTLFLSRVVQPGTVLIGHDWPTGELVGWVLNTSHWDVQVLLGHVKKSDSNRGTLEISGGDKCFEQWYVRDLDQTADDATEYFFKKVHGAGDLIPTALRG